MEGGGTGSSSSSCSSSRWNPTKEQISILEGLYKQGIRTPSAEQIQEITGKLKDFGNIEGKNVFYWFQNHKARQRQKQKQERFAYFTTLLHHPPPLLAVAPPPPPPPPPQAAGINVVCSPYYLPVPQFAGSTVGFYQPQFHPPVFMPGSLKGMMIRQPFNGLINKLGHGNLTEVIVKEEEAGDHETLQLFPLHPTGILEETRSSAAGTPAAMFYSEGAEDRDENVGSGMGFIDFLDAPRGE